jgi:hypothetical protein
LEAVFTQSIFHNVIRGSEITELHVEEQQEVDVVIGLSMLSDGLHAYILALVKLHFGGQQTALMYVRVGIIVESKIHRTVWRRGENQAL